MIRFIIKGLLRDRSRSVFPVLIVATGVFLCVVLTSWMQGVMNEVTWSNAIFYSGHIKVMTRAYEKEQDQLPNDLALLNISGLLDTLNTQFPDWYWTPRIQFGGLLDVPDGKGETRAQSPVMGIAVDLHGPSSRENELLNLEKSLVDGKLPDGPNELLLSKDLAERLKISPGDQLTLISNSMFGSIAIYNFRLAGIIKIGISALDRGMIIAEITDIQNALDMTDAAGEILGFSKDTIYRPQQAEIVKHKFNELFTSKDEFAPVMRKLTDQPDMLDMYKMATVIVWYVIGFFVFIMAIVLWNTGLMGSIRRYGEMGIRLAMGEEKVHVYSSLLIESIAIGAMGAILGTVLGLALSYYLQFVGIDISGMMNNSTTMLMPGVMRARVSTVSYLVGFIPGLFAPFLGTLISGIGIYKRQTFQLFKELEV